MYILPKFRFRRFDALEKRRPDARKNIAQVQHGHVAANAVAMPGDIPQAVDLRRAHFQAEVIELRHIRPRWEVGIAPVRDVDHAFVVLYAAKAAGIALKVLGRSLHVEFRMFARPRMVQSRVVPYKIEKECNPARPQLIARVVQILPRADAGIRRIFFYGIGRADHITWLPPGQSPVVCTSHTRIGHGDFS